MKVGRSIRYILILAVAAVLYYVFITTTGLSVPCLFERVTGWRCPGCGITALFCCLFAGDIKGAFEANRFLFATSWFIILEVLIEHIRIKCHKKASRLNSAILVIYIAALIVWCIVRNVLNL